MAKLSLQLLTASVLNPSRKNYMPLLKNQRFIDDFWFQVETLDHIPAHTPLLVSLDQWQQHREVLLRHAVPLGLRLANDQPPELVTEDLAHFTLIALDFPKFTDGRSYSYARILREHHGFEGEIRATGNILRDQLPLLQRCGFDALVVPDRAESEGWVAAFSEISVVFQPTTPIPSPPPEAVTPIEINYNNIGFPS
jgi:uncharacterized protein (DUF934 family)